MRYILPKKHLSNAHINIRNQKKTGQKGGYIFCYQYRVPTGLEDIT
jgi:hypothetical protein